jgi:NADH:ubiquinone oxidoreductase subunit 4 (subunit M)
MSLATLLYVPSLAIALIYTLHTYNNRGVFLKKVLALTATIINLIVSLVIYILYNNSYNNYQFVLEYHNINYFDIYLGVDGISIYFVLLTTIIMPIALLSN